MKEKYISSSNKKDRLMLYSWMPDREPPLIVQVTHGMAEHLGRYEEFAHFLNSHGIGVIGHDTLGHGKSVQSTSQMGFFAKSHGDQYLVADIYRVTCYIRKHYPESRIVLLGHSMGSFVSRSYLTLYGSKIDGAILMGTGDPGWLKITAGSLTAGFLRILHGDFYRSNFLNYVMLDSNDRYFTDYECKSWLSGCQEEVDRYLSDKNCGFQFTVRACLDFFRILKRLAAGTGIDRIPKSLPILLLSGEDDAIGNFGKGVRQVYERYKKAGIRDVTLRIYPGLRHELLHEINREKVQEDILEWLSLHS